MEKKEGFTIIEFLLIMIIISILIMISYPRLFGIIEKAYDTNIKISIGTFRNFMNMFYQDNNKYPVSTNNYNDLINDVLIEYGEIPDLDEYVKSHNYSADNDSDPKTYELELVSSKTNKTYIITPNGVTTSP
jgi:general secretion pathway protein G